MKCTAIVSIRLEVPVEGLQPTWGMHTVAQQAKTDAMRMVKEVCESQNWEISVAKVTAIMTEVEG